MRVRPCVKGLEVVDKIRQADKLVKPTCWRAASWWRASPERAEASAGPAADARSSRKGRVQPEDPLQGTLPVQHDLEKNSVTFENCSKATTYLDPPPLKDQGVIGDVVTWPRNTCIQFEDFRSVAFRRAETFNPSVPAPPKESW